MTDFTKLEERYRNDPDFHILVKNLENIIETLRLTPSEIRDAAMFACIKFELTHVKQIQYDSVSGINWIHNNDTGSTILGEDNE